MQAANSRQVQDNELLDDCEQPPVADEHITNLPEMFVHHNVEKVLGIHLIHAHFKIPKGTILLGTNFENPPLRWTRVTGIDKINPVTIHGHIYALTKGGLYAYELQDGPLPDLSGIGPGFLDEFINYIIKNNLLSLIGLQVLGCAESPMSELILNQGTVMLDSSSATLDKQFPEDEMIREEDKLPGPTRIMGWKYELVNDNPRV